MTEIKKFPLENYDTTTIPIIKVTHNNVSINFMVDTGCDYSYIDDRILDLLLLEPTNEAIGGVIYGSGAQETTIPIYNMKIAIGDVEFDNEVIPTDLSNAIAQFKNNYGINIRGTIGSNFFDKYHFAIDFKNKNIYSVDGRCRQTELDFGNTECVKEVEETR